MTEDNKPPEESAETTQSSPDVKAPEIIGAVENSQPATQQQLTEVNKNLTGFERATLRWTRTTACIGLVTGAFICLQWCEMRSGGVDTHELAVAARKQADVAEASIRPWMVVDLVAKKITFDSRGAQVFFEVRSKNLGHSPALNVVARGDVFNSQGPNIIAEERTLCPPGKGQPMTLASGATVFPEQPFVQPFGLILGPKKMDFSKTFQGWRETDLLLSVVACIDYVVGLSGEHHQTYAAIFAFSRDNGRSTVTRGVDVLEGRIGYSQQQTVGVPSN